MDISPQRVRSAEFATVKRGLDPDEVRAFLNEVANELERAQNQSTAMEARARAAVARLQEISESTPAAGSVVTPAPTEPLAAEPISASVDQAETISRTLLLAQRTADNAIAEARVEATRLRDEADDEAQRAIESSQEAAQRLIDEARDEARRTGEAERVRVEAEVNALLARRDFLESDVDHLQTFLVDERTRLRDAAASILDVADRVPAGLGEVRRPLLSAADDDTELSSVVTTYVEAGDSNDRDADVDVEVEVDAGSGGESDDPSEDASTDVGAWSSAESAETQEISRVDASRAERPGDGDQLVIRTDIADDDQGGRQPGLLDR